MSKGRFNESNETRKNSVNNMVLIRFSSYHIRTDSPIIQRVSTGPPKVSSVGWFPNCLRKAQLIKFHFACQITP